MTDTDVPVADPTKTASGKSNRKVVGQKKTAKKAATKKAVKGVKGSKKSVKKTVKKESNREAAYGVERDKDLPWNDRKVALFKALKALKATSASNAVTGKALIDKSGGVLNGWAVRHYSYHAKAAGLIDVAKIEGVNGWCYYLTAKGAAIDPAKALKEQEAAKKSK